MITASVFVSVTATSQLLFRPAIHAYRENMTPAEYFDVLIVGAGILGIDAAYRIHEKNPDVRYAVLERRDRLGGRGICSATRVCAPTVTSSG